MLRIFLHTRDGKSAGTKTFFCEYHRIARRLLHQYLSDKFDDKLLVNQTSMLYLKLVIRQRSHNFHIIDISLNPRTQFAICSGVQCIC